MKQIVVFALLAALTGCSDDSTTPDQGKTKPATVTAAPTSVDYYLAHEDELRAKLTACNAMSATERRADAACETAANAQHRALGTRPFPKLPVRSGQAENEKPQTNPGQ